MERTATGFESGVGLDWGRLYASHAPELIRFLERVLGDADTASDTVQDVFVRAMRREATLRDHDLVRPWLYRIASNLALNQLRRRRLLAFVRLGHGRDVAIAPGWPDLEGLLVKQILQTISSHEAITLVLHYHVGFSQREIAALHSVSEETVKSRIARGRRHFLQAYRRAERGEAK